MAKQVYDPEDLKQAEERPYRSQGLPTSTSYGNVKYNSGKPKAAKPGELSASTGPGDVNYDSSGDIPEAESSLYNSSATKPGRFRFGNYIRAHPRRSAAGGGAVATIVGIIMFFSLASGPLEFIHIAELLKQFHFTNNENFSDTRSMRSIIYTIAGKSNRTRLGLVTNKYADRWESQLEKQLGLKPLYTAGTNRFAGFEVVDESLASDQLRQFDEDGIDTHGSSNGLVDTKGNKISSSNRIVSVSEEKFRTRRSIIRGVGSATDTNKLVGAISSRLLIKRGGVDFHPLKNIKRRATDSLISYITKIRDEAGKDDRLGSQSDSFKSTVEADKNGTVDPNGQAIADEANGIIGSAESAVAEGVEGQTKLDVIKSNFTKAGPAIIVGVLCSVKAFGDNIPEYQYANIILPEMRLGFRAVSIGSQITAGQDVNGDELGALAESFDDPTTKTSWTQARSIQAELGQPQSGPEIPSSAKPSTVGDKPEVFDILDHIPLLGTACFVSGGFISKIPGIGSLANLASETLVSSINFGISHTAGSKYTLTSLLDDALSTAAGQGVNVFARGAEFGNLANYGARLAANDQALSEGGRALTPNESTQLSLANDQEAQDEFQSHSIAYRLFNPYDYRTAISKVIDNSSTSPEDNLSKVASMLVSVPKSLLSLGSIFNNRALAASAPSYDYGFPEYGFSAAEQSNPEFDDPFDNADVVENQLGLDKLNTLYGKCFSTTIDPATGALITGKAVKYSDIASSPNCNDKSDAFLRYRFYIADTVTAKSLACYEGDDVSCSEVGFDNNSSGSATTTTSAGSTGSLPSGSAQDLATQLKQYIDNGKIKCTTSGCPDIVKTAAGQSTQGGSCEVGSLDSNLLGMLLELAQMGHSFTLTAVCSDHPSNPTSLHHQGKAADFGIIDGVSLGQGEDANGTIAWTQQGTLGQQKINIDQKLINDIATFMPKSGTGFGQIQCHPNYPSLSGFNTFEDACHHQHVEVDE